PRRREAVVPLRARVHVRAEPVRRLRRSAPSLHREAGREVRKVTADKRVTLDEIVSSLSDGMTIGIGGWGSRRKPMSSVRAMARSSLKDLTVVSYGGPDVGLLCAPERFATSSLGSSPLTRSR